MTCLVSEELQMEPHYRIVLTRSFENPDRSTLVQTDRAVGETFLQDLPVEWAGMILIEDAFKISVQWLLDQDHIDMALEYFERNALEDFRISVFKVDDQEPEEILISEF
jgi:hypothetical protein